MASDSQLTNPPELTRASPVIQIETDLLSESSAFSVSHSQTTLIGRKVKRGDYEYGYGSNNKKRNKVVVFEDNRDFVRVYNYSNGEWYCNGCFLINDQKLCGYFKKNFFHPPSHHLCEPINRQEYVEDQQRIKEIISRNLATSKASKSPTHENLNDTVEEIQASQNSTATEESSTTPRLNRIVDLFNFEYSFNELAERKKRITIYEVDRKYVRQYKITENEMWYCINCQTACIKKSDDDKVEIYGDHQCDPILASEYKVSDKLLLEKSNALKNGSKNASSAMPKSSNVASSSNGSSSKQGASKQIADTNLSSSNNISSLRKLEFYEWMFKSNDRSHIIVFENDKKQYAREYKFNMDSNQVECIRCLKANPSKSCIGERNPIDFSLMVPVAENHNCVAFRVIENDKQLPKKTANKRKISNKENEPSIVKKSKSAVANVEESAEHENNENSPSEQTCNDILAPPSEVASNISTVQSDLASAANSNVIVKNQE
uniref:Uncharacterized protein n=1 Tax=Panagrolaimus davidi TaxID=227884 RepID=A0A914P502_9BILA